MRRYYDIKHVQAEYRNGRRPAKKRLVYGPLDLPDQPNTNFYQYQKVEHKKHHKKHRRPHHEPENAYANNRYQSWPELPKQETVQNNQHHHHRNRKHHNHHHNSGDDYLPPFIRKYNRRNKQLINLLEGTIAPPQIDTVHSHSIHQRRKHHRHTSQKSEKWLETNMFEEQRPQTNSTPSPKSPNDLPGLNKVKHDGDLVNSEEIVFSSDIQDRATKVPVQSTTTAKPAPAASRLDHFQFHRVASPRLVGAGSFGLIHKQRLPFVAITDRRPSHPKSDRSQ